MSSSAADQVRADLREAYNAGDLTQIEYLAELGGSRVGGLGGSRAAGLRFDMWDVEASIFQRIFLEYEGPREEYEKNNM